MNNQSTEPLMAAFVINMHRDTDRLQRSFKEFNDIPQIKLHRFEGRNGDQILTHPYFENKIWQTARRFSPKKTIGIAGTHILLANSLVSSNFYEQHRWALVLEDDVKLKDNVDNGASLHKQILDIVDKHPSADIIRLHCIFNCPTYSTGILSGSAAAFLISESGARKLSQTHITFPGHIDWVMNSKRFNIYNYNIVSTFDEPSPLKINEVTDPGFWIEQPVMRIFDKDIKFREIILFLSLLGFLCILCKSTRPYYLSLCICIFACITASLIYNNKYTMYYECSDFTHFFGLTFSFSLIMYQHKFTCKPDAENVYLRYVTMFLAWVIFIFHCHYEEDRRLR